MNTKDEFERLVRENITRDGVGDLLEWLGRTDFYTAPASTRHHGAFAGGLVLHSLNVYHHLLKLCEWYQCKATLESIAIVALFHDLCKVGTYKVEQRWRKDDNQRWEQYPVYVRNEDFAFGGHGSKSVYLVHSFMTLLPDEAAAINCHMGQWDSTIYSNPTEVYERNSLAWLLHVADEAASYLGEERDDE
jgi:hypothetical protein